MEGLRTPSGALGRCNPVEKERDVEVGCQKFRRDLKGVTLRSEENEEDETRQWSLDGQRLP